MNYFTNTFVPDWSGFISCIIVSMIRLYVSGLLGSEIVCCFDLKCAPDVDGVASYITNHEQLQ